MRKVCAQLRIVEAEVFGTSGFPITSWMDGRSPTAAICAVVERDLSPSPSPFFSRTHGPPRDHRARRLPGGNHGTLMHVMSCRSRLRSDMKSQTAKT
jgi:hypothetical protein